MGSWSQKRKYAQLGRIKRFTGTMDVLKGMGLKERAFSWGDAARVECCRVEAVVEFSVGVRVLL